MKNSEKIDQFINSNSESTIKDYHDKLFENLKVLNEKEDRLVLWQIVVTFLYIFASNLKVSNFSIGPISINDASLVLKLIPLIFVYVLYDLHSVSQQKQEILLAFDIISKNRFDKGYKKEDYNTYLVRIYRPYAFSSSIIKLIREKPHFIELIIGVIVLLPIIIIGILPYIITFSMLMDIWRNHMNDFLGKLSFFCSLWVAIIIIYQLIVRILIYRQGN